MKKPLNKVALALWILAAVVAAGEILSSVAIRHVASDIATTDTLYVVAGSMWSMIRGALMSASALVAYGTIIEIVDQIRWNGIHNK